MYIVSGASRGIGKFIFESLKSQKKNVIGLARKADPDKNIIECDVSNFESIKSAHEIIKKRHKKILSLAKGFRGRRKNCYKTAKQSVEKALQYAYRDRRKRKSDFRSLWIQRINAAVRQHDLVYSQFMRGIKMLSIGLNRKALSELAITNHDVFMKIVADVKQKLAS